MAARLQVPFHTEAVIGGGVVGGGGVVSGGVGSGGVVGGGGQAAGNTGQRQEKATSR